MPLEATGARFYNLIIRLLNWAILSGASLYPLRFYYHPPALHAKTVNFGCTVPISWPLLHDHIRTVDAGAQASIESIYSCNFFPVVSCLFLFFLLRLIPFCLLSLFSNSSHLQYLHFSTVSSLFSSYLSTCTFIWFCHLFFSHLLFFGLLSSILCIAKVFSLIYFLHLSLISCIFFSSKLASSSLILSCLISYIIKSGHLCFVFLLILQDLPLPFLIICLSPPHIFMSLFLPCLLLLYSSAFIS